MFLIHLLFFNSISVTIIFFFFCFKIARDKCKTDSDCSDRDICRLNIEGVKDCVGMYNLIYSFFFIIENVHKRMSQFQ